MLEQIIESKRMVVFIGVGSRSVRTAQALLERKCGVRVLERRTEQEFRRTSRSAGCPSDEQLHRLGVVWGVDGEGLNDHLEGVSCAILSPGVSIESSVVGTLARREIPMFSHVELDLFLADRDSVLVTGTNGKTTAAHMISSMIMHSLRCSSCSTAQESPPAIASALVLTASAYEIESSSKLKPLVAACTNGFPAYLERYGTRERYLATLRKAFERQDEHAYRVINLDDDNIQSLRRGMRSQLVGVSCLERSAFRDDCRIFVQIAGQFLKVSDSRNYLEFELPPSPGLELHNRYNAGIAVGVACALQMPNDSIQQGLLASTPVAYRQNWSEFGDGGIPVCNDAKSTNVHATRAALEASANRYPARKVVLLVGGIAAEGDWLSLLSNFRESILHVVCYGADGALLATYCDAAGVKAVRVKSFVQAVEVGISQVSRGCDATLVFSPGCVSLDEFGSFEERGAAFDRCIKRGKTC